LFPNCALTLGIDIITEFETVHEGVSFSNLFVPSNKASMGAVLLFFLLDIALWTGLGWYLEQILPKEFGVQLRPWFLFTPEYWSGKPRSNIRTDEFELGNLSAFSTQSDNDMMEAVSGDLKALIEIQDLRRTFGAKVALNRLSLKMYEGQIFALLGHNGAGKTTTINMLTGMISPSSGGATIQGLSIDTQMNTIRKSIGCCPQHDILWLNLTVRQILTIFAQLKGLDPATCVAQKLADVGLTEKVDTRAEALSGGMKRKLSLCMSLIGEPKVVFLDEPTSGMDPFSRRSTWNLLQNSRAGRAMVLTTHFMVRRFWHPLWHTVRTPFWHHSHTNLTPCRTRRTRRTCSATASVSWRRASCSAAARRSSSRTGTEQGIV
jgi:ATP-binding cassette subfamily A (ABC1) protein 3